jgi:CRISPR-associated endoribonuclease Cas6
MRIKISFVRDQNSSNSIPLHHQKLLSSALHERVSSFSLEPLPFNFSSIKGTSRIQNGYMRFLSTKVTMVISAADADFCNKIVDEIFSRPYLTIGKLNIMPRFKEIIADPPITKRMRYICISPLILFDPKIDQAKAQELINPNTKEFADALYNVVMDQMEKAGYTEEQLAQYAEFESQPDKEYVEKVQDSGKKFARFYKCSEGFTMLGYLLPFTLYAHPDVHDFIWKNGIGVLNNEGYGMVDVVTN